MGCFSWYKVDTGYNVEEGSKFKLLIPKEFADEVGFDSVKDEGYQSYGYLGLKDDGEPKYDIYELIAVWNEPDKCKFSEGYTSMKEIDENTDHNRLIGIDIACYDEEMAKLKYPLRLVNYRKNVKYEDFEGLMSVNDTEQGWSKNKADESRLLINKLK